MHIKMQSENGELVRMPALKINSHRISYLLEESTVYINGEATFEPNSDLEKQFIRCFCDANKFVFQVWPLDEEPYENPFQITDVEYLGDDYVDVRCLDSAVGGVNIVEYLGDDTEGNSYKFRLTSIGDAIRFREKLQQGAA